MPKEIWKDVNGYEGLYQVSNLGRVKSLEHLDSIGRKKKEKNMSTQEVSGYLRVWLSKGDNRKGYLVHRLVAKAFIPNICNKREVNHKDGNKQNNNANNLEWVTSSENQLHAYKSGLDKPSIKRRNDYRSKPVIQILNGKIINEFPSAMEAQRQTGFKQGTISNCCRGNQKIAYGFVWKYKDVNK